MESGAAVLRLFFQALTQDYLDLTLRGRSAASARIIERPGLWMPEADIARLLADVRTVAARALPEGALHYGFLTGDQACLDRSVVTVLYHPGSGQPVAFNALAIMDTTLHGRPVQVVHMGLVMVDPGVRNQGFSWILYGLTCLVLFARNQLRPLWLSNVTQVPAILGMVTETFSNVFPSHEAKARRSFEHLLLARQIMTTHRAVFGVGPDAEFDEERFVIINAYTGGSDDLKKTFDEAPKHRDPVYNDFCARELDYVRGDDVLQLCQLNLESAKRFILKDVPRRSLPAVLAALAFVLVGRAILPLVYWLSSDRHWGILRPWRRKAQ